MNCTFYRKLLIWLSMFIHRDIMKRLLIILLGATLLFSGCVDQATVENGDNVSVDYVGSFVDGEVFDTSIETVANENGILNVVRDYAPLELSVGARQVIPGFDEGMIGMKVGESKTVTIPPEDAYGATNPELIDAIPAEEVVPTIIPRIIEVPLPEFEATFGTESQVGAIVIPPGTNYSFTVMNLSSMVELSHNFEIGDVLPSQPGIPWNWTVSKMDDTNITLQSDVQVGEMIQYMNYPWDSTVVDANEDNIILQHNPIPDETFQTPYGPVKVSFNGDSILMDRNGKFAGKTLVFDITLISIDE